jgi:protein gp37
MSAKSSIAWTETTWNPTTGCDRVSPGCDHCYAMTLAKRLKAMGQARYQADGDPRTSGPGFGLTLHEAALGEPYRWRQPRLVFVNSMSDLFHARVPYEFVERVWGTMAGTPRHTYQILSKRPDRMARFAVRLSERFGVLPNVWLGTSIESAEYLERAEHLLRAPATVRFISAEPLLGDLVSGGLFPLLIGWGGRPGENCPRIHWVIGGGESGRGARPCDLEWLRSLAYCCRSAGVPFFLKQLGSVATRELGGQGKGEDPERWPADLRVREYPAGYERQVAS